MFSVQWKLSRHTGGGGVRDSVTKWHMGEGGSKIARKSVTYYLNGPYGRIVCILFHLFNFSRSVNRNPWLKIAKLLKYCMQWNDIFVLCEQPEAKHLTKQEPCCKIGPCHSLFWHTIRISVANFINILRAHFGPIFLCQKISNPKHSFVIFGAKILYEKCARKMLMKLTPTNTF